MLTHGERNQRNASGLDGADAVSYAHLQLVVVTLLTRRENVPVKSRLWLVSIPMLACAGGAEAPADDKTQAGKSQPAFCAYMEELREPPKGECSFAGTCKVAVAYYCDIPSAASRKKYDCTCKSGVYACEITESGLSIDPTCIK